MLNFAAGRTGIAGIMPVIRTYAIDGLDEFHSQRFLAGRRRTAEEIGVRDSPAGEGFAEHVNFFFVTVNIAERHNA